MFSNDSKLTLQKGQITLFSGFSDLNFCIYKNIPTIIMMNPTIKMKLKVHISRIKKKTTTGK
jgi:hypothetical protein